MLSLYAILSALALALPMVYTKFKSFCDENNISYDIIGHLGRTLSRRYSQAVNKDVNTKDRAD